ncbi:MAG TPA: RsmE family RNA methyltransferase, partial [Verrucomicrobium sp.]|nr:RsmE family RNA methyltransferase [Verrucomicrobium sp.]
MGALARFYLAPSAWNPDLLVLEGDEAHHCTSVMRRQVGDEITIFNGAGRWARCRMTSVAGRKVGLEMLEEGRTPAPAVSLSLLQAIPKGGNMEWIVEKSVELGVNAIHPVLTARTVVKLDRKEAAKKQEKWQRLALEACKQCGQNWLPVIHAPASLTEVLAGLPEHDLRIVAAIQEDARHLKAILEERRGEGNAVDSALLCIGPEGDFTPEEYELARESGCLPMTLGTIILRVETATMYGLSVLGYELG